jgi:hypothetical protein
MATLSQGDAIDRLLSAGQKAMRFGMDAYRPPDVLYHFTDAAGVTGILTNKELWASRAMSLNDASEMEYGIARTKNYLDGRIESETDPRRLGFLKATLFWLDGRDVDPELAINIEHFVASFCGRPDRSGLWLHYGRSGRGYALGFESARLAREPFELLKVAYRPTEQDELIDGAIRLIEEEFLDVVTEQDVKTVARAGATAAHLCATSIRAIASRLKDPSFEDEEEWRLTTMNIVGVHIEDTGISLEHGYRTLDGRIIPYMVAPYGAGLPLSEVIVGFGVDLAAAEGALGFLFREEKVGPRPVVRKSSVPVR